MLSLHLLGEHRLYYDGRDISAAIHYRKGWALLAYLVIERGRRHRREHLAQLIWPQLPAAAARTNLRQVVANLNRVFQAHGAGTLLQSTREAIGLYPQPQVAIDLLALEPVDASTADPIDGWFLPEAARWAEPLDGQFLAELSLSDCDEFEQWLQLARSRISACAANTLQRLSDAQEAAGRPAIAIATARRLAALDQWNENHQRRLMRLLAGSGRHGQAMGQFQVLRTSLRAELDSEPERATVELHSAIQRAQQADSISGSAGAVAAAGGLGVRRWISAVYCEVRMPANVPQAAGANALLLARVSDCLQNAGGWGLTSTDNALWACFGDDAGPASADHSALQAALAANAAREAFGVGIAMALCSGMARIESLGGTMGVLGNPGAWAVQLCRQARAGQVVLCDTLFRPLQSAFELQALDALSLRDVSHSVRLWELGPPSRQVEVSAMPHVPAGSKRGARTPADLQIQRLPAAINALAELTAPAGDHAAAPLAWLAVLDGTNRGKRVSVSVEPLVIGRSSDSDLQISHRAVSRHHCAIWLDGDCYRICDMGSTNRTRVNDATVQETELSDGDRITLGDSVLQFGHQTHPPTLPIRRLPAPA